MKFKILFNNKLIVQCLENNSSEIILSENTDQHIHYPIPIELKNKIGKFLECIIEEIEDTKLLQLKNDIMLYQSSRYENLSILRSYLNPKIINKCNEFKLKYPEYFI